MTVRIRVISFGMDEGDIAETLVHESQIHGYKAEDQVKGYTVTSEKQDHEALKNKNERHKGYQRYKSVFDSLNKWWNSEDIYKNSFENTYDDLYWRY